MFSCKQEGHFVRRPNDEFWCIKKVGLKSRLHVLQFKPHRPGGEPCQEHGGPCWRVVRRYCQPLTVSVRRTVNLQGGLFLCPRLDAKVPPLARRCYMRVSADRVMEQTDSASELQSFLESVLETKATKTSQVSQEIFRDVATLPLQDEAMLLRCPDANAEEDVCQIVRHSWRLQGHIITCHGVFLCRKLRYKCHTHNKTYMCPCVGSVRTNRIAGDIIGNSIFEKSYWQRAWRLFQETESWFCLERDLRATTAERLGVALSETAAVRALDLEEKASLHEALLQVH